MVDSEQLDNEYSNEWQWVDYGQWGIDTHKAGIEDRLFDEGSLSVAVSASAIKHMPAKTQRHAIGEISRTVRVGGSRCFDSRYAARRQPLLEPCRR